MRSLPPLNGNARSIKARSLSDSGHVHTFGNMSHNVAFASKKLNEDRRALLKEIDNAKFS